MRRSVLLSHFGVIISFPFSGRARQMFAIIGDVWSSGGSPQV